MTTRVRFVHIALVAFCLWLLSGSGLRAGEADLSIGSKSFTESYVLGEIAAQLLESEGFTIERQLGLGGTLVAFEALKAGSIDLYPEYTGTLTQAVLGQPGLGPDRLSLALQQQGLHMQVFLGFENSYAMGINGPLARNRNLVRISDLVEMPELRAGFSHEFLKREDGWPALRAGCCVTACGLPIISSTRSAGRDAAAGVPD